jgi:hypothetical protein
VTSVVALVATTLSTPAAAATHSSRVGVTHATILGKVTAVLRRL